MPHAYLNWIFFDNQFNFVSGSSDVLQVQAYYPYGLEIQGLSDKAMMKAPVNYKYNGGNELEDEDGINYQNTFFRKYDAQIGRFTGIDVFAEVTLSLTPYQFGMGNPISFNDPTGALNTQSDRDLARSNSRSALGRLFGDRYSDYENLGNANDGFGNGPYASFWRTQFNDAPGNAVSRGGVELSAFFTEMFNYSNLSGSGIFEVSRYLGLLSAEAGEGYHFIGTSMLLSFGTFNETQKSYNSLYSSLDAAAIGWATGMGNSFIAEPQKEYAGLLFSLTQDGQTYYGHTKGIAFSDPKINWSSSPPPESPVLRNLLPRFGSGTIVTVKGHIHSHTGINGMTNNNNFSTSGRNETGKRDDVMIARNPGLDFYLVNPIGQLISFYGGNIYHGLPRSGDSSPAKNPGIAAESFLTPADIIPIAFYK